MPRGKQWAEIEDKMLSMAWCAASEDAVNGTDQKSEALWGNILKQFTLLQPQSTRSLNAIKSRWSDINREVGRFAGCVAMVTAKNESGKTEEDRLVDALQLYLVQQGEPFAFMPAYDVLSKRPKWSPSIPRKRTLEVADEQSESGDSQRSKRPMGSKAAVEIVKESKLRQVQYKASLSIAKSMQRKNELLNEWACIDLFNMPDVDPGEKKAFFAMMRAKKMAELAASTSIRQEVNEEKEQSDESEEENEQSEESEENSAVV